MKFKDFHIGLEFWLEGKKYRCTGLTQPPREAVLVIYLNGEYIESWGTGPYSVPENVFDEEDIKVCTPTKDEEP